MMLTLIFLSSDALGSGWDACAALSELSGLAAGASCLAAVFALLLASVTGLADALGFGLDVELLEPLVALFLLLLFLEFALVV